MSDSYTVKLDVFEGPLDLLLRLIEKRKLHINDVSLAKVTDDYISYVERLDEFPTRDAAHFILIASTLVLIKSKSLMPMLSLSEEEEEDIEELEKRLALYKRAKELSRHVEERFGKNVLRGRREDRRVEPVFSPTAEISVSSLFEHARNIIRNLPKQEAIPQLVVRKVVSVEEMLEDLTKRVTDSVNMSFREFAKEGKEGKARIVVGFLALLELVKRGIIVVKQDEHFEEIYMTKRQSHAQ